MEIASIQSEPKLPADSLHILERIDSRTEHKEDWCGGACLLVGHFKWYSPLLHILCAELLFNIEPGEFKRVMQMMNEANILVTES